MIIVIVTQAVSVLKMVDSYGSLASNVAALDIEKLLDM
jgi:hypothetical protein